MARVWERRHRDLGEQLGGNRVVDLQGGLWDGKEKDREGGKECSEDVAGGRSMARVWERRHRDLEEQLGGNRVVDLRGGSKGNEGGMDEQEAAWWQGECEGKEREGGMRTPIEKQLGGHRVVDLQRSVRERVRRG
jgi:hypothetical protein